MKLLILSCSTGGGHNSAALALKEAAEARGDEAVVFDHLTLASRGTARVVGDTYVNIVKKTPMVFGVIYRVGMVISKLFRHSPVYLANGRMAKYLGAYLAENRFDAVLMPHLFPAETLTYMKRRGMSLPPTVYVSTDYTLIPFVEETDCDIYTIPHEDQREETVLRGIPRERIRVTGIPTSVRFRSSLSRQSARRELGLPEKGTIALVLGGSMGAGSLGILAESVRQMLGRGGFVVVICGSNKRQMCRLSKIYRRRKRVAVIGETNRMEAYLRASNIVYTKPGGLSSTESAVSGTLLVHTTPIPGCETENRRFFRKRHLSVSANTAIGQAAAGMRLLRSPRTQERMLAAQRGEINPEAAEEILRIAEGLAEARKDAGG